MSEKSYPLNAPGPFYVINGDCIACEAPMGEAPELISFDCSHCYFKKQPSTPQEIDHAMSAMQVSCVEALRYAGDDPVIVERLTRLGLAHLCDKTRPGDAISLDGDSG